MASARPLDALAFLGAMMLTALAALALTLAVPDNRYLRYQQLTDTIEYQSRWIYERLHFDPTPVDVALIGSSGMLWNVNTPLLEKRLAARGLPHVHVANLSLPESGLDISAMLAREAMRTKHPRLIVAMASDKFPRPGHPAFKDLADIGDILRAPLLVNLAYFEDVMRGAYRQIKLAVVAADPPFFGYTATFAAAHYAGTEIDDTSGDEIRPGGEVIHHGAVRTPEYLERNSRIWAPPVHPSPFGPALMPYEFAVAYSAYRDMARLARDGHSKFVVLYVAHYKGPPAPIEIGFLRSLAPVIIGDWSDDDDRLFMDSLHRNTAGAALFTTRLADELAKQLKTPWNKVQ